MSGQFDDGEIYERLMGRWSRVVGKSFLAWLDVPKGKQWLDAGCGNGAFTEELIAHAAPSAVMAVDPSEGQIDYARKRAGTKNGAIPGRRRTGIVICRQHLRRRRHGSGHRLSAAAGESRRWLGAWLSLADALRLTCGTSRMACRQLRSTLPSSPWASSVRCRRIPAHRSKRRCSPFGEMPACSRSRHACSRFRSCSRTSMIFGIGFRCLPDRKGKFIADMSAGDRNKLRECARQTAPIQTDGGVAYEAYANAIKGRVPQ